MSKQFKNRQSTLGLSCLYTLLCTSLLCLYSFTPTTAQSEFQSSIDLVGIDYASSGECQKMNVLYMLRVYNVGSDHTGGLDLILALEQVGQLGAALEEVIEITVADSSGQSIVDINQQFVGDQLPLATIDFIQSNASIDILIELEINPYFSGLTAFDGLQAVLVSSQDNSIIYDYSDGGPDPLGDNLGVIGDTGGTNDPLPFDIVFMSSQFLVLNNNINIALNSNCNIDLDIDFFAENPAAGSTESDLPLGAYYDYVLWNSQAQVVLFSDLSDHIGEQLQLEIIHKLSCASFWTQIVVLDNMAPVFLELMSSDTVSCFQDFNTLPAPIAVDNCSSDLSYHLVQQIFIDNDLCDDQTEVVQRHWLSMDAALNQSIQAIQEIVIYRDTEIDFPEDVFIECSDYSNYPQSIDPTDIGAGIPQSFDDLSLSDCNYSYVHADQLIPTCGEGFKIIRLWSVLDWCSGTMITGNNQGEDNIQIIEVADTEAPLIIPLAFSLNATEKGEEDFDCYSLGFIPAPIVTDACNTFSIYVITPVGEAIYLNGSDASNGALVPAPGLGLGVHTIVYQAIDLCGNVSELNYELEIIDEISPTMICDEISTVALNNIGVAEIPVYNFDDGSFDNCCLSGFEGSRDQGLTFTENIFFDCGDAGQVVDVLVRLSDCFGNSNICSVEVIIEDNTAPVLFAPLDSQIPCQQYYESILPALEMGNYNVLEEFGSVQSYDNCGLTVQDSVLWLIDNCGNGWIERYWQAIDQNTNTSDLVKQTISVYSEGDWSVTFPEDLVYECGDSISLDELPGPSISGDFCFQIAQSYSDEEFVFTGGNCKTILRTWELINWCTFPDEAAITHVQVIDILDSDAPEITINEQYFYLNELECGTLVVLEQPLVSDCSDSISISVDAPFSASESWPVGSYSVNYTATDWCGNQSSAISLVHVQDTIAPVIIATDQLNINLSNGGEVSVFAADFNIASYDNCTEVYFSFSADSSQTQLLFDCDNLGLNTLALWVVDDYGNASFVEVSLLVSDLMGACGQDLFYNGLALMPDGQAVSDVELISDFGDLLALSDVEGGFSFELLSSDTMVVEAQYGSSNWANGVSTLDLVMIKKHILGIEVFNNPYQYWAADVNGSASVSTLDIVYIQKLILGLLDEFPTGENWTCVFDTGSFEAWGQSKQVQLHESVFGEGIDIKVIKLGDVNFSAVPQ